ncbi:unnamed protein product [Clonostachys rosea]|uniref:Uncharacterized protein n=1 Tax=Bionectria ochroleuca TaxID=29856 RepID=A0ABY6ULM2_BIOOC|nr:unnamed protein product [Clonostachys rosea]
MTFLSRNKLYETEKPYTTDFPVEGIDGATMTNHTFDVQSIVFHDARSAKESFELDRDGFCYINAETSLKAEDATPEKTEMMDRYTDEVVEILRKKFPQYQEIRSMDFQVRKRHPDFPDGEERRAEFAQPATVPHSDFSKRGAFLRMADIFPGQESHYKKRKFNLIKYVPPQVLVYFLIFYL